MADETRNPAPIPPLRQTRKPPSARTKAKIRKTLKKRWQELEKRGGTLPPDAPDSPEAPQEKRVQMMTSRISQQLTAERDNFIAQLVADQGGEHELSALRRAYIRRLVEMNTIMSLLIADIEANGLTTVKGKTRSVVETYAKMLDRFDKLSRGVGMDRRQKKVKRTLADLEDELPQAEPEEPTPVATLPVIDVGPPPIADPLAALDVPPAGFFDRSLDPDQVLKNQPEETVPTWEDLADDDGN